MVTHPPRLVSVSKMTKRANGGRGMSRPPSTAVEIWRTILAHSVGAECAWETNPHSVGV